MQDEDRRILNSLIRDLGEKVRKIQIDVDELKQRLENKD